MAEQPKIKEEEKTLTAEQIKNWRNVLFGMLEKKMHGAGMYAIVCPDEEIIEFWKHFNTQTEVLRKSEPKGCTHANSFTSHKGKYCIDCEKYI